MNAAEPVVRIEVPRGVDIAVMLGDYLIVCVDIGLEDGIIVVGIEDQQDIPEIPSFSTRNIAEPARA